MMEQAILYIIPGSRHSKEAEECLKQVQISYKKIELNNRDLLAAATFDLDIQRAPALYTNGYWYQGLTAIKEFTESNNI